MQPCRCRHGAGTGRDVGCAGNCWQAPAISADGGLDLDRHGWRHMAAARRAPPAARRRPRRSARRRPVRAPSNSARAWAATRVWELVKESGLRGRGGAYFPVGAKWETARNTPSDRKFLLVNAEEGEPGIYKDRHLLEGDPHRVLEGVLIAALGMGATDVVIFVNGEAKLGQERLLAALDTAPAASGVAHVPVEVRLGAGGYVLGEETALINAIHGQRAEPLARPPFPAVSGLQASPTVINNVESLANLPDIVLNGAEWFRSVGTAATPGTKLVSLAGAVRRPGLYEVPSARPSAIIDECGGGAERRAGAPCWWAGRRARSCRCRCSIRRLTSSRCRPWAACSARAASCRYQPTVRGARRARAVAYNSRESCGKCTPCREGTVRLLDVFDHLRRADIAADDRRV